MLPLSFQNITKHFDKTLAVNDLSLEVRAGELFFLLGPSGCGKTTCLRMVAGFLQPDGGTLKFGEKTMNFVPPHQRNTGMVFQNYALWPHMNAAENIAYGLRVRKVPRAEREHRVLEALRMVRLEDRASHYPNQLSGGQQQRVALARALVINPDVLLLDEPLSNLDAQLRLELRAEIKRLHNQTQTTALYVTHDQDEALSVADRIGVMRAGILEQVGTPRELYRTPKSRFVASFIGETNFLDGQISAIDSENIEVETRVGKLVARRANGETTLRIGQNVTCSIRPESWQIDDVSTISSTRNAVNSLRAQVESVLYGGASEQLQLRLIGGRETANRVLENATLDAENRGIDNSQTPNFALENRVLENEKHENSTSETGNFANANSVESISETANPATRNRGSGEFEATNSENAERANANFANAKRDDEIANRSEANLANVNSEIEILNVAKRENGEIEIVTRENANSEIGNPNPAESGNQSRETANRVLESGGNATFTSEISDETWREIKAALLNPLRSWKNGETVALSCRAEDIAILTQ